MNRSAFSVITVSHIAKNVFTLGGVHQFVHGIRGWVLLYDDWNSSHWSCVLSLACPGGLLFKITSEREVFGDDFLWVKPSSTDVLPEHSLMPQPVLWDFTPKRGKTVLQRPRIPAGPWAIYFCGPDMLRKSVCLCSHLKFSAESVNGLGCTFSCYQIARVVVSSVQMECFGTRGKEATTRGKKSLLQISKFHDAHLLQWPQRLTALANLRYEVKHSWWYQLFHQKVIAPSSSSKY